MKPIIYGTSLKFKLNMIKTFIDPQIALLAPISRLFNKTNTKLLNNLYKKQAKKLIYSST